MEEPLDFINRLRYSLPNKYDLYRENINLFIYNGYLDRIKINDISSNDVIYFIIYEHPWIMDRHLGDGTDSIIYYQPIMYLIYYLIWLESEITKYNWVYSLNELGLLFSQLGICMERD